MPLKDIKNCVGWVLFIKPGSATLEQQTTASYRTCNNCLCTTSDSEMARTLFVFSLLALSVCLVRCYPEGPPATRAEVCNNLMAGADSPHKLQVGNGDYFISTNITYNWTAMYYEYTAGEYYIVQLQSISKEFEGFLVQAQDPSGTTVGVFKTTNSVQQVLTCDIMFPSITRGSTIGHSDEGHYEVQNFTWKAPTANDGVVNFMYTVVREEDEYFGPINAGEQTQKPLMGSAAIAGSTPLILALFICMALYVFH